MKSVVLLHCQSELITSNPKIMKQKKTTAQAEPQEQKAGLLNITVRTHRNCYMMEVGDEGFMYYNTQNLVEGFMIRVGLKKLDMLTNEEISKLLKATVDGSAEKKLQEEIDMLRARIVELKKEVKQLRQRKEEKWV